MLPLRPPLEPMLSKLTSALPDGDGWLFEPKWDGFRVLVFRDGDQLYLQSRDLKPLDRYFPELAAPLRANLPERCVVDGEIVIVGPKGLDFDALLLRIHPAASRVNMLAQTTPASVVVWDLLAIGDEDLRERPLVERRARLEAALAEGGGPRPPIHLTPATTDRALAADWFSRFEGAGLDGVMAKRLDDTVHPGKRAMLKIKHARTADCVVAGFRWFKGGKGTNVGSLLLGLHDAQGVLHHAGIASSFSREKQVELLRELEPLRAGALENHPWAKWRGEEGGGKTDAAVVAGAGEAPAPAAPQRRPGMTSRWNRGKDLSWEPLRLERVVEVGYDHLQGDRFRHATKLRRWRPDKEPRDCTYAQLEESAPYELAQIFGTQSPASKS